MLVVDDDRIVLRAVSRIVQRLGYDVTSEEDPDVALETLRSGRFAAVLADLNMPMRDANHLFAVCARKVRNDVPLLVITGEDDDMRIEAMLAGAGVEAILKKPARASLLARALDAATHPDDPTSGLDEAV